MIHINAGSPMTSFLGGDSRCGRTASGTHLCWGNNPNYVVGWGPVQNLDFYGGIGLRASFDGYPTATTFYTHTSYSYPR
jgi:hypothetical protein